MPTRYGREKVDLWLILAAIERAEAVASTLLVESIMDEFDCCRRTAKDAIAVLRQAGYIAARSDGRDARNRIYQVTPRGLDILSQPGGRLVLRFARTALTGCPSPTTRERIAFGRPSWPSLDDVERALISHSSSESRGT